MAIQDLSQMAESRNYELGAVQVPSMSLKIGAAPYKRALLGVKETARNKLHIGILPIIQVIGTGDIITYPSRYKAEEEMLSLMTTAVVWPSVFSSSTWRAAFDSGDWSKFGKSQGPVCWPSFTPRPQAERGKRLVCLI